MNKRLEVFTIIDKGENKKSFWLKIGAAFQNQNGSFTVYLDALPIGNKLIIQEPRERTQGGGEDFPPSWGG